MNVNYYIRADSNKDVHGYYIVKVHNTGAVYRTSKAPNTDIRFTGNKIEAMDFLKASYYMEISGGTSDKLLHSWYSRKLRFNELPEWFKVDAPGYFYCR